MPKRTVGWSPNPNKANILKNSRDFQGAGTRFSAKGRNALAKAHMARRNAHMLELFLSLSALTSRARTANSGGRLRNIPTATPSCTAAILQRHSYPEPDQAAHFVPGQLRLNGLPVWEYLTSSVGRLYVMDMFADVERLHANFNRADSEAENVPFGLKALAARCAIDIIRDSAAATRASANRQLVWNVYRRLWLPGAEDAIAIAIENKEARPRVPQILYKVPTFDSKDPSSFDPRMITNLPEISASDQSEWNIEDTIAILRDYRANSTAGPTPADVPGLAQRADADVRGHDAALETE